MDQLDQERARALDSERKAGEELATRNRELAGKIHLKFIDHGFFIGITCC
jgi:hypothetical protein